MTNDVPYIGITRFSVLAPKGSGLRINATENQDRYLSELFNYSRMSDRMFIFSEIAAPILQTFSNHFNYRHLVQYSPELPFEWKNKLFELSLKFPVIRPIEVTDEDIVDSVRKEVLSWPRSFRGIFVWFRIDDDDVLSIDYLEALSKFVSADTVGMAVSFPRVVSGLYANRQFADIHNVLSPSNSQGQAYICRANRNLGIIETPPMLPHHRVSEFLPLITSGEEPFAFWTRHALQDTSISGAKLGAKLSNLQAELGKFPFYPDSETIFKFPTLEKYTHNIASDEVQDFALAPNSWKTVNFKNQGTDTESIIRMDYAIEFEGTPDSGTTMSFKLGDQDSATGYFPRDTNRGDYRRLFVDQFGHGTLFVSIPANDLLEKIRVQSDPGKTRIKRVDLTISECR